MNGSGNSQPLMGGHRAIELEPVPTAVEVAKATASDGSWFMIQTIQTPIGTQTYFFPPDIVEQLFQAILQIRMGGLMIAAPDQVPPFKTD